MSHDWSADDAQCEVVRGNMVQAGTEVKINLNVALPASIYDWVQEYAAGKGVSMSELVRALVISYRVDVEETEGR